MVDLLISAASCLGHGYMLMICLNVIYSQPVNRTLLKTLRLAAGLALVGWPVLCTSFAVNVGILPTLTEPNGWLIWHMLALYCCVSASVGVIVFPLITAIRCLRRVPSCVRSSSTYVYDIAQQLGSRPVGDGKHAHLAAKTWNDIFRVEFTEMELAIASLPKEWDGLSILQLSDLHFYGTPGIEYFQAVFDHCAALPTPDIVVLSGDIIDDDRYLPWIDELLPKLRWKHAGFAILGNHDWWNNFDAVRARLHTLGWTVLSNTSTTIDVLGQPLLAIGHEGPWFKPAPTVADNQRGFRLLISHSPDNIHWAQVHRIGLMLSGHNHGGQIRLPIMGSMFVPSKYSRRFDHGTFQLGNTVLHVNRGLSGKEPIRIRCLPQVSLLKLRAA
jgi:uncharacterized protein